MEERVDPVYRPRMPSPTDNRNGLIRVLTRDLNAFSRLTEDGEDANELAGAIVFDLEDARGYGNSSEFDRVRGHLIEMLFPYVEDFSVREAWTNEHFQEFKNSVVADLKSLIQILKKMNTLSAQAKTVGTLKQVEKDLFASKGLPEDVAGEIVGKLTGRRGTLDMQAEKIRSEVKKAGKKTKKNRTKRRKTHGRRV